MAVLPFVNMSSDNAAGFFCDGLAEEIDLLSRSGGLRFVARTSSFQFKGVSADVREIGRKLGSNLLLEGAIRGRGERYRITVRLLSASDGLELWASRYDRTVEDVLQLEVEIAAAIAQSLTSGAPPAVSATDPQGAMLYMKRATPGIIAPKPACAAGWSFTRLRRSATRARSRRGPGSPGAMS